MWDSDLRPIRIADFYGKRNQVIKAMEECGELASALARVAMHGDEHTYQERLAMIGELADVSVMVDQIVYLYDAKLEFSRIRDAKLARQMNRMRAEEALLSNDVDSFEEVNNAVD